MWFFYLLTYSLTVIWNLISSQRTFLFFFRFYWNDSIFVWKIEKSHKRLDGANTCKWTAEELGHWWWSKLHNSQYEHKSHQNIRSKSVHSRENCRSEWINQINDFITSKRIEDLIQKIQIQRRFSWGNSLSWDSDFSKNEFVLRCPNKTRKSLHRCSKFQLINDSKRF